MTVVNWPVTAPRSLCAQRSRTFADPAIPSFARSTDMLTGPLVGGGVAEGLLVAGVELSASSTTGGGPRRPREGGGGGEVLNTARYLSFDPGTSATQATWLLVLKSWWLLVEF